MILYTSNSVGNLSNCIFQNKVDVKSEKALINAVNFDHVCAEYKNNYRSSDNFIKSDCIPLDCDNDHSDNPVEWVTSDDVSKVFQEVAFVVVYSRNHQKVKGSKSARPRFHVYFKIPEINDADEYVKLKRQIASKFTYFDSNALDSARLIFGTQNPQVEVFKGSRNIVDFLNEDDLFVDWDNEQDKIGEGSRNNTMSHIAGKLIKRYGATNEALDIFLRESEKCEPPLEEDELKSIWYSAIKFGRKVSSQEGYISPDEYNSDFKLKPDDFSDVGQAKVLSSVYMDKMGFSPSTDFIVYNGGFWEESKEQAQGIAQELTERQLEEAEKELEKASEELKQNGGMELILQYGEKKAVDKMNNIQLNSYRKYEQGNIYKKYAIKRRDSKGITNSLKEVKPMLLVPHSILDSDEFLLNTPNETINLKNGSSKKADAFDYITKQTTVSPSDEGMDIWLKALDTIFLKDKELIDYVQRIVGLASIGKVYVEALIISYGNGSNGKSTFWNAIARVLGTYSGTISAEILTVGYKQNVKHEIAEAKGKRLLIAAEMEESVRLSTSNVKKLCSTDQVKGEKKYKDPFDYTPSHTLVLYTNHLPKVGAIDNGTWRRLIVIPFDAKIKGTIKNYGDYLYENAGGAILKWIIEGAKKVIADDYNLVLPKKVKDAIDSYKENNDWFGGFLEECCELDNSYTEKSGQLYTEYRAYCIRTGEFTRGNIEFYNALDLEGFEKRKTRTGSIVQGLKLKSEFL